MIVCKECNTAFESEKSFHGHLRKHKLRVKDYYEKYYPKICLYTGKKLNWKEGDSLENYLLRDFIDKTSLNLYFENKDNLEDKKKQLVKELDKDYLKHNILPCQAELASLSCSPNFLHVQNYFDIQDLIKEKKYKSRFEYFFDYNSKLPLEKIDIDSFCINIDSREKSPYRFYNSIVGKLNFGDYCIAGSGFNNIFVERKAVGDFGSTLVSGYERFCRELDRVRAENSYLIILVEFNLHELHRHRFFGYANSAMISHQMRNIYRNYSDVCQFTFGGTREQCVQYVVEFLVCGDSCRKLDLQFYIDCHKNKFCSVEFTKNDLIKLYE